MQFLSWFQPSIHSLRGFLARCEWGKTILTASIAATIAALTVLQADLGHLASPVPAWMGSCIITLTIAQLRRLDQGAVVIRDQDPRPPVPRAVDITPHKEVNFRAQSPQPIAQPSLLRDGRLSFARWGNGRCPSRSLPRTGRTWLETVQQGGWRNSRAIPVDIPATLGLERGRWHRIRQGIRGLLVPDERRFAVAYMLCEPSSHYYRVMTGSERMPASIEERI